MLISLNILLQNVKLSWIVGKGYYKKTKRFAIPVLQNVTRIPFAMMQRNDHLKKEKEKSKNNRMLYVQIVYRYLSYLQRFYYCDDIDYNNNHGYVRIIGTTTMVMMMIVDDG